MNLKLAKLGNINAYLLFAGRHFKECQGGNFIDSLPKWQEPQ